jgi:hypothetical protein
MSVESPELVLDASLYPQYAGSIRFAVAREDIAGLAIEAGDRELVSRINPRKLKVRNGKVVNPETGEDILENFGEKTPLQKAETRGAKQFYSYLVDGDVSTLVVSLSPSGGDSPYLEGRINVAMKIDDETIDFYGIVTFLPRADLFNRALALSEFAHSCDTFSSPDDLRTMAFTIQVPDKERTRPWDFLGQTLRLDSDAFDAIEKGTPWELKEQALSDASPVAEVFAIAVENAVTHYDFIRAGATAERQMQYAGWTFNEIGCPGKFNTELLNQNSIFGYTKDAFGNARKTWEYHSGECVYCKRHKDKVGPCGICSECEDLPELN